jgi:putative endonuclease
MSKADLVCIMANRKHGAVYTGVSGNPVSLVWQHKNHAFKDSFTNRYDREKLVWYEVHEDVEAAIIREKRIKD